MLFGGSGCFFLRSCGGKGKDEMGEKSHVVVAIMCGIPACFSTGGRLGQVSEINNFSLLISSFCSEKKPRDSSVRMVGWGFFFLKWVRTQLL